MIKTAVGEDVRLLKGLWKEAFGDDDRFIDFYFANYFNPQNMLVYKADNKPASMLTLIDADLGFAKARYVYAVATLKAYRGRNLSAKLLDYAADKPLFLAPASESLFKFYADRGFESAFYAKKAIINGVKLTDCDEARAITADRYCELRKKILPKNAAHWSGEHIKYAVAENAFWGGFCLGGVYNGKEFITFGVKDKSTLILREFVGEDLAAVHTAARRIGGVDKISVKGFWQKGEGEEYINGMLRSEGEKPDEKAYLNVILD